MVDLAIALQGDVPKGDVIFGVVVVALLLPVFYVIGKTVAWFKNLWFVGAWKPLMPVLAGATIAKDGGVASTSRLSGTYQGVEVYARMTPDVERRRGVNRNGNQFAVGVRNVSGKEDWTVRWVLGIPLVSESRFAVNSPDSALATRLEQAGVIGMIEGFGQAVVRYHARDQTLEWEAYIEPAVILSPEQFRRVLGALLEVSLVGRAVNY